MSQDTASDREIQANGLQLAEEFVLAALARELDGTKLRDGDEIKIDQMNNCDCVPIYVDYEAAFQPSGRWNLASVQVESRGCCPGASLSAVYRFKAAKQAKVPQAFR